MDESKLRELEFVKSHPESEASAIAEQTESAPVVDSIDEADPAGDASQARSVAKPGGLLLPIARSEAIILAAATLSGYAIVFSYEAGFCYVYSIPPTIISLNLSTGLAAAGAIALGFYTYVLLRPFARWWKASSDDDYYRLGDNFIYYSIASLIYVRQGGSAIGIVGLIILFEILRKTLLSRFQRPVPIDKHPYAIYELGRKLSPITYFSAALLTFLLFAAFALGRASTSAGHAETFTVGSENYIVLRVYGDYLVAAPFTIETDRDIPVFWFKRKQDKVIDVASAIRVFKLGDGDIKDVTQITGVVYQNYRIDRVGFWNWIYAYER